MNKICRKCSRELPATPEYFRIHHADVLRNDCKECQDAYASHYHINNLDKHRAQSKIWRTENKESKSRVDKKYREENKDNISEYLKQYAIDNSNKLSEYQKEYKQAHKPKRNLYEKTKKESNPSYKIITDMRTRMWSALQNNSKSDTTEELLGCTIEKFKEHIESQFEPWMTWENWGRYTWHIDHIDPLNTFDMSDPEQQKKAFHYTNCRPLHWKKNLKRSKKN